jgi:hypothetical protein
MRKISVAITIKSFEKSDVIAKGFERRQKIGKLIPTPAFSLPVVVFAEGAENLHGLKVPDRPKRPFMAF